MIKQFSTPCFIRKNTPELRAKLYEIGWRIGITANFRSYGYLCTNIMDNEIYAFIPCKEGINVPGYIDCGTNEALFLDLAGMRSDTDKGQWFYDTIAKEMNYNNGAIDFDVSVGWNGVRRATAQEIIEWHKKNEKL